MSDNMTTNTPHEDELGPILIGNVFLTLGAFEALTAAGMSPRHLLDLVARHECIEDVVSSYTLPQTGVMVCVYPKIWADIICHRDEIEDVSKRYGY